MSDVRIGTSGWSYPTGRGTWNGVFYPTRPARTGRFDELAFYARFFDTVEVNSTFYRQPAAAVTRSWTVRTPASFRFSVKLHQKFTHPAMFVKATGAIDVAFSRQDVDEFRSGISPLADAGRLDAVLAQFPPGLTASTVAFASLEHLLEAFREYPLAVELRHRSWSDRSGETVALLNAFGAAWVQIDEPKFPSSIRQHDAPNLRGFHYMRLHGRNRAHWWQHDRVEDRYDYLYSTGELDGLAGTVDAARRQADRVFVYLNNHFAAKAVVNATMLKRQLGLSVAEGYPASLVARYPELEGTVTTPPSLLSRTSS